MVMFLASFEPATQYIDVQEWSNFAPKQWHRILLGRYLSKQLQLAHDESMVLIGPNFSSTQLKIRWLFRDG
tara:strand:+ start:730 stop:942 length:213 start_codon:yes stop_codon:yes gene_type:complete